MSITVIGKVGREPQLSFSNSGVAYAKFSVAQKQSKKVNGKWEDQEPIWFDVTCFNDLAEHVAESLTVGQEVIVEGTIEKPRTFEMKSGDVGVSLPLKANHVGVSLRWSIAQSLTTQPAKAVKPDYSEEPF